MRVQTAHIEIPIDGQRTRKMLRTTGSTYLTLKALFVFFIAFTTNIRWLWIREYSLKQRASLAYVLSMATNKRQVSTYLLAADPSRLWHLATQVFLIAQAARVQVEIAEGEFKIVIEKSGTAYSFVLVPALQTEKAPFVHDLHPLTDIFFLGLYDFYDFSGGLVIDVGGYIGDTAVYFAKRGALKVCSYEPNPINYRYLVANLGLNGVSHTVTAVNCAISSESGKLLVPIDLGGAGSMLDDGTGAVSFDVSTLPPTSIFEAPETISLLKIDCKGCELEILRDCLDDLRRRVRQIIVEVDRLDQAQRAMLTTELTANGFRLDDALLDMLYFSNEAFPT